MSGYFRARRLLPSNSLHYTAVPHLARLHSAPPWYSTATPCNNNYHTTENVEQNVSDCERIISYTANSKLHIITALNASACNINYNNATIAVPSNSALAVLGDARMAGVLCRWWWWDKPSPSKVQWSMLRYEKCSNVRLAALGSKLGLHKCIILNPGTTFVSEKLVATMVEAVLGAVYLDGGEDELERVMRLMQFDRHTFL